MATKKYLELQEFNTDDLISELEQTEIHYQKMRFDHSVKGIDNPLLLREMRRDIARMKGELRRRELKAMTDDQLAGRSKIRMRRRKNK